MNREDLNGFEKLVGQVQSTYEELSVLSKKSPNDTLSKFKLTFVNLLLRESNNLLGDHYRPFEEFGEFDEDNLPFNSDVVFIMSQYLQCFEKFRTDNVVQRHGFWYWRLNPGKGESPDEDGYVYVRTVTPKRLRN